MCVSFCGPLCVCVYVFKRFSLSCVSASRSLTEQTDQLHSRARGRRCIDPLQSCSLQGSRELHSTPPPLDPPNPSHWNRNTPSSQTCVVVRSASSHAGRPIDGPDLLCSDQWLTSSPGEKNHGGNTLWVSIYIPRRTLSKPLSHEEGLHPQMATAGVRWGDNGRVKERQRQQPQGRQHKGRLMSGNTGSTHKLTLTQPNFKK